LMKSPYSIVITAISILLILAAIPRVTLYGSHLRDEPGLSLMFLLAQDDGGFQEALKMALKPFPVHLKFLKSRPKSLPRGTLLLEGLVSHQPLQQGLYTTFGRMGIPEDFQTSYMEANLQIVGSLSDGRPIREHWILESHGSGEYSSKRALAADLCRGFSLEIKNWLLEIPISEPLNP
jgi:hypothetical protein